MSCAVFELLRVWENNSVILLRVKHFYPKITFCILFVMFVFFFQHMKYEFRSKSLKPFVDWLKADYKILQALQFFHCHDWRQTNKLWSQLSRQIQVQFNVSFLKWKQAILKQCMQNKLSLWKHVIEFGN